MLERLLRNNVLANLAFVLVMVMGVTSYRLMPREQDPTINFNWININTIYPGASAPSVEKQVTNVLEDAIRNVADVKFISSTSRETVSSILVRFEEISTRVFEKRLGDLRREVDSISDELPESAIDPFIFEITTANAFPSASIVVSSLANDNNLRRQAELVKQDLERLKGVDQVLDSGLAAAEMRVDFIPARLERYRLSPLELENTIRAYYRDLSAGSLNVAQTNWSIKFTGSSANPTDLAALPILTADGEITLGDVAEITLDKGELDALVRFNGQAAILLSINKKENQNVLELVERIQAYLATRQALNDSSGVRVTLVDDQTQITQDALRIMQNNALLGLFMVLLVTWLFLGRRIALLTGIAIPFILAGTFWFLSSVDQTLNVSILLGVVISLGMLVDDAVVVVEAIYYRLQRGADTVQATLLGLREVMVPVTTAVLTTIAAFLPLMLLPGILGKFMLVIPLVVTSALAISLIEAYWLLPAHVIAAKVNFSRPSRMHLKREAAQYRIRQVYCRLLLKFFRRPVLYLILLVLLFVSTLWVVAAEKIKIDFFASDPIRLFYVNLQMPAGTNLEATMQKVQVVEAKVRTHVKPGEVRSMVSYAGQLFTETEPLFGDQYGQVFVSLNPKRDGLRSVDAMLDAMRADVMATPGIEKISFLRLAGGPPVEKAINVKVRGNDYAEIDRAMQELKQFMQATPGYIDISDDNLPGQDTLDLRLDTAAIQRTGITPDAITRSLELLVDGQVIADFRHRGETVDVRLQAQHHLSAIDELLNYKIPDARGNLIALSELVHAAVQRSPSSLRHYNYRRTITLSADIDKAALNTVQANDLLKQHWQTIRTRHPEIDLDFTGVLDDIEESLSAISVLFLFGLGLIYLILGTQFRSYFQPFLIIMTVPMAFIGVVLGLLISRYPLSLFTLYGIVALAGISVNAAIVLISTANNKLAHSGAATTAIFLAARRRVIPILITSLTTIAGLFSLATGLGGHSLIWGPVAASMVFGLSVSTILTLFYIPLMYRLFMRPWPRFRRNYRFIRKIASLQISRRVRRV